MKFYFTYGSSGMAYEGGWTEVEAPHPEPPPCRHFPLFTALSTA